MAIWISGALQDAIANLVDDTVGTSATLVFATSASPGVEVATLTLGNPAFDTASGDGTIELQGVPLSDTDATGGVMGQFMILAGGTTQVLGGTVSTSAADINFAGGVTVTAGDTVQLTSFTITMPAGG